MARTTDRSITFAASRSPTLPKPAPRQYFLIDGHYMAYLTAGNPANPPVILIHGWLCHAEVWKQTIAELQTTHYCIAVDLLGLSVSDKPASADYSVPAHARRILALIDSLGIKKFTLIGHSLGGQISQYLAAVLVPDRVTTLIDVAGVTTGKLSLYTERFIVPRMRLARFNPWMWTINKNLVRWFRSYARLEFSAWFYNVHTVPYDVWALDREMAMDSTMHISACRIGDGIHALDLAPYLGGIRARTLVIFGVNDGIVPPDQGQVVKDHVKDCQLVMIDQCGHFPMYEKPELYLKAVFD
ncbi:MAG TPA: alpha/beta hydrolase, partial [Phototrophicaceae bacterium]|nr:alpha/beta hydrolase [Phototrophicaceae bacterium]